MNISAYAKTVASAATGIVAWGTAAATLLALVPDKRVAGVVAGLLLLVHFVQSFLVWLTKNQSTIDADVVAVQKIIGAFTDWRGSLDELKTLLAQIASAFTTGSPAVVPPTPAALAADPSAERHV